MSFYKKDIDKKRKVELVQMSQDTKLSDAASWAKKEKFPWPTVLYQDQESTMLTKYASRGIPHYILVDRNGKIQAQGFTDVVRKVKGL